MERAPAAAPAATPGYYFGGRVDGQHLGLALVAIGLIGALACGVMLKKLPKYHEAEGWKSITATVAGGVSVLVGVGGWVMYKRAEHAQMVSGTMQSMAATDALLGIRA
jgi:hypothetical protein